MVELKHLFLLEKHGFSRNEHPAGHPIRPVPRGLSIRIFLETQFPPRQIHRSISIPVDRNPAICKVQQKVIRSSVRISEKFRIESGNVKNPDGCYRGKKTNRRFPLFRVQI
jgi:hypothetical protein